MAKINKWKTQGTRCEAWDTEGKKINVRMWVHTVDTKDNKKKKQRQKGERNGLYRETVRNNRSRLSKVHVVFVHGIRGPFPRNPPIHRPPLVTLDHTTPPPQFIALRPAGETHDLVCILSLHCYPGQSPLPRLETHEIISPSNPSEVGEDIPL